MKGSTPPRDRRHLTSIFKSLLEREEGKEISPRRNLVVTALDKDAEAVAGSGSSQFAQWRLKKMPYKLFRIAMSMLFVSSVCIQPQLGHAACADSTLPAGVRSYIVRKFPSWKIRDISDLVPRDQQLWSQLHPGECPGAAVGHFKDPKKVQCAVLLSRQEKRSHRNMVIVVQEGKRGEYEVQVLQKGEFVIPDVLYKLPPGEYTNYDDSDTVRTEHEAIVSEQLEAGAFMYYWVAGRFRRLLVSE